MKFLKFFAIIGAMLLNYGLTQAGTESGGGGDAAILPNGEVVLADIFLDSGQPQPDHMPQRVRLSPTLYYYMDNYASAFGIHFQRLGFKKRDYSEIYVLLKSLAEPGHSESFFMNRDPVDFFAFDETHKVGAAQKRDLLFYEVKDVSELNQFCASGGRKAYRLEKNTEVTQVACTSGESTFLVGPLFRKMSVKQQSLLLFHERLTTMVNDFGSKNYAAIAGITTGLQQLISLRSRQDKGEKSILSSGELDKIRNLYLGTLELSHRDSRIPAGRLDFKIHKKGGGMVAVRANVADSAFVGVSTKIPEGVKIDEDASIGLSKIWSYGRERGQHLQLEIGRGSKLDRVQINGAKIKIGSNSDIWETRIIAGNLNIGKNFKAYKSAIDVDRSTINNGSKGKMNGFPIKIDISDDQEILETLIGGDYELLAPDIYQLPPTEIVVNHQETNCQKSISAYTKNGSDHVGPCSAVPRHPLNVRDMGNFIFAPDYYGLFGSRWLSFFESNLIIDQFNNNRRHKFLGKLKPTYAILRAFSYKMGFKEFYPEDSLYGLSVGTIEDGQVYSNAFIKRISIQTKYTDFAHPNTLVGELRLKDGPLLDAFLEQLDKLEISYERSTYHVFVDLPIERKTRD